MFVMITPTLLVNALLCLMSLLTKGVLIMTPITIFQITNLLLKCHREMPQGQVNDITVCQGTGT